MIGDFLAASYKAPGGNLANTSKPVFVVQILVLNRGKQLQNSNVEEGATTAGDSPD